MAEPNLYTDKLDDAAPAIFSLSLHDGNRVWKGIAGPSLIGVMPKG